MLIKKTLLLFIGGLVTVFSLSTAFGQDWKITVHNCSQPSGCSDVNSKLYKPSTYTISFPTSYTLMSGSNSATLSSTLTYMGMFDSSASMTIASQDSPNDSCKVSLAPGAFSAQVSSSTANITCYFTNAAAGNAVLEVYPRNMTKPGS